MIPYSRQDVTEADIEAVVDVLRSDFLTQGPVVKQFEEAVARVCRARFAVSTTNATSALHSICHSLGIKQGSLVWVSAVSFVASANCVLHCGGQVDFVDVTPSTGLISLSDLSEKLVRAEANDCLPQALIVVHLAGQSCQMREIAELCRPYGIRIIEDASHALGGFYEGKPIGNCEYSDAAVFSFHPVKPITSGEGGIVVTNDPDIESRLRRFISHGIVRSDFVKTKPGDWYYEQQELGYNYRLSDIHAALGLSQLSRIKDITAARTKLAEKYDAAFSRLTINPLTRVDACQSAWHLYIVLCKDSEARANLHSALRRAGLNCNVHYMPIPSQPFYESLGCSAEAYPGALEYSARALSLPLYASMDPEVLTRVAQLCALNSDEELSA